MRKRVHDEASARKAQVRDISEVAKAFTAFRPASEVLTRVRAVPTILAQYDHATRVGGQPIERITLVHGPSGEGKTYFCIALLLSFLMRDHLAALIDAERTTPITWLEQAMGKYAAHPLFMASRPDTYEQTRAEVRALCNQLRAARERHELPDMSGIIVLDSIRKLVPKDQWEKFMSLVDAAKAGDEKARDRMAQHKAQMNAAWCDELVPLLEKAGAAMIIIAREIEDADRAPVKTRFGMKKHYKTGGGSALFYDASLDVRIERESYVYAGSSRGAESAEELARAQEVYGERHRISIHKTKVAGRETRKVATCYFHTSNGSLVPEGFDRARDLVDLGKRLGVVKVKGSWLTFGQRRWQGDHAAVKRLGEDAEAFAALDAEVRALFRSVNPTEHDPETGEVA